MYDYRLFHDLNSDGKPIFVLQRRIRGRHRIGNWENYIKIFQENEKEEAEKALKHLQSN